MFPGNVIFKVAVKHKIMWLGSNSNGAKSTSSDMS